MTSIWARRWKVASPAGFRADPALVWRFYSQRRAGAAGCAPNPGHHALVTLERASASHRSAVMRETGPSQ